MSIYKQEEFKAFIKTIEEGEVAYWSQLAEALGVDNDTITAWKKLPEAQEAIKKGITHSLKQMEVVGKKDWRMHEAKLKMLGLNPVQKIKAEINDSRKEILDKYGLNNDRQTEETKE